MDSSWNAMYSQLSAFQAEQGHCRVSSNTFPLLVAWLGNQRSFYKNRKLESWKIEGLNTLGFDWGFKSKPKPWQQRFQELQKYKEKQGHCRLPSKSVLHGWVLKQRTVYNNGKLESWKIERLNTLGFDWDPFAHQWGKYFEKLQDHKKKHGDFHFSRKSDLSAWVNKQRRSYKKGSLESWKIERLNALEFDWGPNNNCWKQSFQKLKKHKEKHGHSHTPFKQSLSSWITRQRSLYRKGELESWKIEQLNVLEFEWSPNNNQWKQNFKNLEDYKKNNGHLKVPFDTSLYTWIIAQRESYKKGMLDGWKMESLDALGVSLNPFIKQWQEHFEQLQAHKEKYGYCKVPRSLQPWVANQRVFYKKNKLNAWKIECLNDIGFDWDPVANQWQQSFEQLKTHKEKYGHCKIADTTSSLYSWIRGQRKAYREGRLEDARAALLSSLGFNWQCRKYFKELR